VEYNAVGDILVFGTVLVENSTDNAYYCIEVLFFLLIVMMIL
jgi:hypothetical protein